MIRILTSVAFILLLLACAPSIQTELKERTWINDKLGTQISIDTTIIEQINQNVQGTPFDNLAPWSPISWESFLLHQEDSVEIILHSLNSNFTTTLFRGSLDSGYYHLDFKTMHIPEDLYLLGLRTKSDTSLTKLMIWNGSK